jgi:hypothetical protein
VIRHSQTIPFNGLRVFPEGAAGFLSISDPHAPDVARFPGTDRRTVWQLQLLKSGAGVMLVSLR